MENISRIIKKIENETNLNNKNSIYKFGFSKFGPLLYGYTEWLLIKIKEHNLKKIFFFSRDGFMMKKAFDILNTDKLVESKYVYFSRRSLRQALFWKSENFEDSLKFMSSSRFISTKAILEYYGFQDNEIKILSKKLNIDLEQINLTKELKLN